MLDYFYNRHVANMPAVKTTEVKPKMARSPELIYYDFYQIPWGIKTRFKSLGLSVNMFLNLFIHKYP